MSGTWDQVSGRAAGSRSGRGSVGVQNGLSKQDVDQLKKTVDVAVRQLKKLRKYELEQVCKVAHIPSTGLKATLLEGITNFMQNHFRTASTSSGMTARHSWENLIAVTNEIARGFTDVLQKRPASAYTHYTSTTMKQDASHESGGASSGSAKAGGGSAAGGGGRWDELAREEVVERSKQDPFVEVTETVAGPMRLERGSGSQYIAVLSFDLLRETMDHIRAASTLGSSTAEGRRNHMMLRSYKLPGQESNGEQEGEAAEPPRGHIWPLDSVCQVNQTFVTVKQRKVFFQGTTRKLKGDCSPLDVGDTCRAGSNRLEVYSQDVDQHAIILQRVRLVDVEEVFRNVQQQQHLTKEQALQRVKNSFKGSLDTDVDVGNDDDSDDDLMATATRLSLRCPLGLVPITCPGRGRDCKHLQCFDLKTFLSYNKNCAGAGWKCGVCNMLIKPGDLVVDTYLDEVVKALEDQGRLAEAEEVEIQNDGGWEVIEEHQKAGISRRDKKKGQPGVSSPEKPTTSSSQQGHDGTSAGGAGSRPNDVDGDEDLLDVDVGSNRETSLAAAAALAMTNRRSVGAATADDVDLGRSNSNGETTGGVSSGIGAGGSSGSGSAAEPVVVDSDEDDNDEGDNHQTTNQAVNETPFPGAVGVAPLPSAAAADEPPHLLSKDICSPTAAAAAAAAAPRRPASSPTSSLGSTDDSGGNSSASPPLAPTSLAPAVDLAAGNGTSSSSTAGGVVRGAATTTTIGVSSKESMGGDGSGSGAGSGFIEWQNHFGACPSGQAHTHPVLTSVSSVAAATTSGSNNGSGQPTGWPCSSSSSSSASGVVSASSAAAVQRQQPYQPEPSYSAEASGSGGGGGGDPPFASARALIGLGGGANEGGVGGTTLRSAAGGLSLWGGVAGGGAMGWESSNGRWGPPSSGVVGGGGGGAASQSLKRPRSSSLSDDLQVCAFGEKRAGPEMKGGAEVFRAREGREVFRDFEHYNQLGLFET